MLETWKNALLNPKKTFKKEKKKSNLGLGANYIAKAGIIAGIIAGIASLNLTNFIFSIILYPILNVVGWLLGSAIYYMFAKLLGGKGDYTKQSYLMSLYIAPLSIVSAILVSIPVVGIWLSFFVTVFGLYLLTFALKEAHNYSTDKAVLTWLIPFIILVIILLIGLGLFIMYAVSNYGSMIPELSQILV